MENQNPKITKKSITYDIKLGYHSKLMCQNYDAKISGVVEDDNRISIFPREGGSFFEFSHSDPDRVIAIARMILTFAEMVKEENEKGIDISENA